MSKPETTVNCICDGEHDPAACPRCKTTSKVPFDIKPGERYTDAQGRTWELTDHSQWKEVQNGQ